MYVYTHTHTKSQGFKVFAKHENQQTKKMNKNGGEKKLELTAIGVLIDFKINKVFSTFNKLNACLSELILFNKNFNFSLKAV